ncbi:MAG: DUF72 domain-containing protein [Acidobacteria bacterium]|nr:DUF72 domain-containing protein [Acidobacteriota bacterium]
MIWIGTSGYSYPEWKGNFYPAGLPAAKMLSYYAERLPTVEINHTFYRMPGEETLATWRAATPERFKFAVKAPRRITHDAALRNCESLVQTFCELVQTLGNKLGVLLFQLPPSLKIDLPLLDDFLSILPRRISAAFEFRHPSWEADAVFERLQTYNLAFCIADSEKRTTTPVATADYGYFRLRDKDYTQSNMVRWASIVRQYPSVWSHTFVYFKHEETGKGPEFAKAMQEILARVS